MRTTECRNCRTLNPLHAAYCGRCGERMPDAPLRCYRLLPADAPLLAAAPRTRRLLAAAIDAALIAGLIWAVTLLKISPAAILIRRSLWIILPSVLVLFRDAIQGRSPGKVVMGLVVVRQDRPEAGNWALSLLRNAPLAIPVFGPLVLAPVCAWQILFGARQRVGDGLAGTTVTTEEALLESA